MELFVIRHGIAEDAAPEQDDPSRELTKVGEKKLRRAVKGMHRLGFGFERVLTSPWARAARTAKLLAPIADEDPIETELLTQPPRAELLAMIAERNATTAVVGHEPWLGELVAWLAFGDMKHGDQLDLKKSGLVWLTGAAVPGGMTVKALLPPSVLRATR